MVVLHEREIRRQLPPVGFLRVDRGIRQQFLSDLSQLVANANFTLVASVIDKRKLKGRYSRPQNPYNLAMGFGLERVAMHLNSLEKGRETYVVIESRGKREDWDAELEFRRVCDGNNELGDRLPLIPKVGSKETNSTGLQLADLIARPIGHYLAKLGVYGKTRPTVARKLLEEAIGELMRQSFGERVEAEQALARAAGPYKPSDEED